jgi:N-acetyl sugar amidotransferase
MDGSQSMSLSSSRLAREFSLDAELHNPVHGGRMKLFPSSRPPQDQQAAAMKRSSPQTSCTRCLLTRMDDALIEFNTEGLCNHCRSFDVAWHSIPKTEERSQELLKPVLDRIKSQGKGQAYDCIIGLSGGVDSTYIALLTKQFGLRPLAVHFDNGWNSELAVDNIERVVSKLGIDLITYVIDWEEFRSLQVAYLRASVIDIEVLTDHAIFGALYDIAIEKGIKTVISGVNTSTESVLPYSWIYDKNDDANIRDIYRKHGDGRPLKNYPFMDRARRARIAASKIEVVRLLDLIVYNDARARQSIKYELGWRDYGGKHHESIFTRFYQCYILPRKFGVNKRKAHLSNLICSGQMTREQALTELQRENYSQEQEAEDLEFVLKKLKLSRAEFDDLMRQPQRRHLDFDNYRSFFYRYPIFRPLKPLWKRFGQIVKPAPGATRQVGFSGWSRE